MTVDYKNYHTDYRRVYESFLLTYQQWLRSENPEDLALRATVYAYMHQEELSDMLLAEHHVRSLISTLAE